MQSDRAMQTQRMRAQYVCALYHSGVSGLLAMVWVKFVRHLIGWRSLVRLLGLPEDELELSRRKFVKVGGAGGRFGVAKPLLVPNVCAEHEQFL